MSLGFTDEMMARGIPVWRGPTRSWFHHFPVAHIRYYRQMKEQIQDFQPDILHTFFFWPIVLGRLLKLRGVIGHVVENREDQGFNWGAINYAVLRKTAHIPDRVLCVSDAVRNVVLERESLPASNVLVIRNGIEPLTVPDERSAVRQELGFRDTHLVVGMVANLNRPVKGVKYFIRSMPSILDGVPNARFVIFGAGRLREGLENEARQLGVLDRVTFAGFRADIARLYLAFDISVLTSLSEGLSIALLESMRSGLPIVATDVGGNGEVVVDGVTGYLVPPRSPQPFADRVVELLQDPERRKKMGAAARREVRERFDSDRVAERYLETYQDVLGPDAPSRDRLFVS